jgi:hypothetical protein
MRLKIGSIIDIAAVGTLKAYIFREVNIYSGEFEPKMQIESFRELIRLVFDHGKNDRPRSLEVKK